MYRHVEHRSVKREEGMPVMITVYALTPQKAVEEPDLDKACKLAREHSGFVWVAVCPGDEHEIHRIAEEFKLHSLAVESVLNPYNRAQLFEYEDHIHVNLTMVESSGDSAAPEPSELHVFLAEHYVITMCRSDKSGLINQVLDRYKDTPVLAERGSFYALYLLAELLTDTYYPIVEGLDDQIDQLEDEMLENPNQQLLQKLFQLKRVLFDLRRWLGPQRDVFNELARRDFPFLTENYQIYFQDVYNRTIRIFDVIDTAREIALGALDLYQSAVANRLNDIMKVLTVFAAILGTLNLVTGFFGMNFVYLPWLESRHAFAGILMFMGVVFYLMIIYFRRKKWL